MGASIQILTNAGTGAVSEPFITSGNATIMATGTWNGAKVYLELNPRDDVDVWYRANNSYLDEDNNVDVFWLNDTNIKYRLVVEGGDASTSISVEITNAKIVS